MSPDAKQLARFARVEPPAELDAWMRVKLRAAVAARAVPASASPAMPVGMRRSLPRSVSREPSKASPARAPESVPLVERLALAVGVVACGVQASAFVIRLVCAALALRH
jgi:hypothetical protein